MQSSWIPHTDEAQWTEKLNFCEHDIYHTHKYHGLFVGEFAPFLFYFNQGPDHVAIPLLVNAGGEAESVYGYPGPVASASFYTEFKFGEELVRTLRHEGVTHVNTRTNPILHVQHLLRGHFELTKRGVTTALDLTTPLKPTKGHRADIKKAARAGVRVVQDKSLANMDWFVKAYRQTMKRVGADPQYAFSKSYFKKLSGSRFADCLHLFFALKKVRGKRAEPISAALFFEHNGICQYHLSATLDEHTRSGGQKLIIVAARDFFAGRGNHTLHLGGGLGGSTDDPLFRFKAGFMGNRLPYYTAEWKETQ